MNNIIYKYDRKNVFGGRDYTEDYGYDNFRTIKKAFRLLGNDSFSAVQIENFRGYDAAIFTWDNLNDYDNDIVRITLCYGETCNKDYVKVNFSKLKKEVYSLYDKESGARKT